LSRLMQLTTTASARAQTERIAKDDSWGEGFSAYENCPAWLPPSGGRLWLSSRFARFTHPSG
jgi:hypothetical protein